MRFWRAPGKLGLGDHQNDLFFVALEFGSFWKTSLIVPFFGWVCCGLGIHAYPRLDSSSYMDKL